MKVFSGSLVFPLVAKIGESVHCSVADSHDNERPYYAAQVMTMTAVGKS
jgi:hypothetical protein